MKNRVGRGHRKILLKSSYKTPSCGSLASRDETWAKTFYNPLLEQQGENMLCSTYSIIKTSWLMFNKDLENGLILQRVE